MNLFFDTETTGLPRNWKAPVTDTKNWPRMVHLAYLLFIPDDPNDGTGHADGYIRFISEKTVLVNELAGETPAWREGFEKMIKQASLDSVEMPWFEPKQKNGGLSAISIYVNYLEVANLIVFPVFECPGNKDQQALDVIN